MRSLFWAILFSIVSISSWAKSVCVVELRNDSNSRVAQSCDGVEVQLVDTFRGVSLQRESFVTSQMLSAGYALHSCTHLKEDKMRCTYIKDN